MANVSVSVSDEIRVKMGKFAFVNWSHVAREAISKKIADLEFLEKFTAQSEITTEDALRMGRAANGNLAKRYARARR